MATSATIVTIGILVLHSVTQTTLVKVGGELSEGSDGNTSRIRALLF